MTGHKTLLVGFGKISAGLASDPVHARAYPYATHAQALREHPAFDWVAVVDIAKEAREVAFSNWGVPNVAADVADLTIAEDIEVAVIATPPDSRPVILEALPNLKAVLVEKPLATDIASAEIFLAACRARGILVAVSLPRRYDNDLRNLVDRVGRPMAVFATYGNGLRNNGTHLVDLIRMQLGEVDRVQAILGAALQEEGPITGDLNIPFVCCLVDGTVVMVNPVSFAHYREVGLDIWGEGGRLQIMHEGLTVLESPVADCRALSGAFEIFHEGTRVAMTTFGGALFQVYENLADVLCCAALPRCTGDEALTTMRVVEAVWRSAEGGGTVIAPRGLL